MSAKPPKYPANAGGAIATLLSPYNSFELYVEDTSYVNLYRSLMAAACPRRQIKFFPIPLAGSDNVIQMAKAKAGKPGPRRLFLVDGDLPYVRGEPVKRIENLYRINAYCIENLLLEEAPIASVCLEADGKCSEVEIIRRLRRTALRRFFAGVLEPLFCLYAAVHKLAPSVRTVGRSVFQYFNSSSRDYVNRPHARQTVKDVFRTAGTLSDPQRVRAEKRRVAAIQKRRALNWTRTVSGKDYLIPVVHVLATQRFGYKGTRDQFARALARHCSFEIDPTLKRKLRILAGYSR